jgi:hypothetical protein
MALVETQMVSAQDVFLPYAVMAAGRTLAARVRESPQFLVNQRYGLRDREVKILNSLPKFRYSPQIPPRRDSFDGAYPSVEAAFKLTGWCAAIATLHYGSVKTGSLFFQIPEWSLTGALAYLVYAYFMRYTIIFPSGRTIVFDDGRPNPFNWHSLIAMGVVMIGVRILIWRWVEIAVSLQAK